MPILSIQLDQSIVDDAIDVGIAMKEAQFSEHAVPPEHILKSSISLGLELLKTKWPRKSDPHTDVVLNHPDSGRVGDLELKMLREKAAKWDHHVATGETRK